MKEDYKIITDLINPNSLVLDLGCGNGELLEKLVKEKNVQARGIEIDEEAIYSCVAKGLSVFHGDIDSGLTEYRDKSFDFVILNQSLQQVTHLDKVLQDALRVGKKVVVGFPNFAFYKSRLQIFFKGRTPLTSSLPYQWYETPNLHFLSIKDFEGYCKDKKINIEKKFFIGDKKRIYIYPNLFSNIGIFLISK